MKFVAALIAAVVAVTGADMIDIDEFNDMYNAVEFKQSFSTLMGGFQPMGAVASADSYPTPEDGPCPCSQCVDGVVKHIMSEAWQHFNAECEKSSCPVIRAHCKWAKDHPKVTQGAIYEEMRPGSIGYSYCYGKGVCKHPGNPSNMTDVLNVFENNCPVTQLDPLMELQAISMMFDNTEEMKMAIALSPEDAMPLDMKMESLVTPITEATPFGPGPSDDCTKCLHGVTCHVMKGVFDEVKKVCASTKCPVIKAHCKWAAQHPEFTQGVLLVKVRPDKFAYGACIADKKCKHGNDDTESA